MRPVLLTGFEPFGTETDNPSQRIAQALHGTRLADGRTVQGVVLPVSFAGAGRALEAALASLTSSVPGGPALVLALGLAARRQELCVERVALNLADAPLPDNDGVQPIDAELEPGGPAARFASLPVKTMVAALRAAGHPAALSLSAGSYVCNALLYELLRRCAPLGVPAGFLHVPPVAVWPLERQIEAVRLALETGLRAPDPATGIGGDTD